MTDVFYICDGCGQRYRCRAIGTHLEPMPAGWFHSADRDWHSRTWPWATAIVACSADCIERAKANVKRRAREDLARFDARVDAVELVRSDGMGQSPLRWRVD